jgi:hypothetical protein
MLGEDNNGLTAGQIAFGIVLIAIIMILMMVFGPRDMSEEAAMIARTL